MADEAKQREALAKIDEKVKAAYALIKEAEALADEAQVEFGFDLAYGMGGTYYPKKKEDGTSEEDGSWYSSNEGWVSSSSQC